VGQYSLEKKKNTKTNEKQVLQCKKAHKEWKKTQPTTQWTNK